MSFIGKTKTLLGLNALQNLVSDSMAIDMGSASTIIAVRGRGIVVDEPSVVAVNKVSGEVIAVGNEAHKMQGREARDVTIKRNGALHHIVKDLRDLVIERKRFRIMATGKNVVIMAN